VAIDDVYQVSITARTPAGLAMNVYAFKRTSATEPTQSDFQTLSDELKELHRPHQASGVTYTTWRARQVRGTGVTWPTGSACNPVGGNLFEGSLSGTLAGNNVAQALPWQCSLVVTHKTATIGRRHRGRTYVYGFCEDGQDSGTWVSAVQTNIGTNWGTFYTAHAVAAPTSGFQFGIWSYRTASGCVPGPGGSGHLRVESPSPSTAFSMAVTAVIRSTVYTQRRRVVGVGA
jgi:hypothetical protein